MLFPRSGAEKTLAFVGLLPEHPREQLWDLFCVSSSSSMTAVITFAYPSHSLSPLSALHGNKFRKVSSEKRQFSWTTAADEIFRLSFP